MAISTKSLKILWSAAAGRCAFPDCATRLIDVADGISAIIGEMAHIRGERSEAARHDANQSEADRNSHENLILLCPTHHTMIDKKEFVSRYTVEKLLHMKVEHEKSVLTAFEGVLMTKQQVVLNISRLAARNRTIWQEYGPLSERAQKHPHNEKYFQTWRYKRITTIVPNNREIAALLDRYGGLFASKQHAAISEFLEHASSYEEWVRSEDDYGAVVRYPSSFDKFLSEESDASSNG